MSLGAWFLLGLVLLAASLRWINPLRGYQFTGWILVAVTVAMLHPQQCLHAGSLDLRSPWLILTVVQLVMFGMGTQMSLDDFSGVIRQPRGVLVGVLCRFTVMPLTGFILTKLVHFQPEVAAGVILIGSCSSGLASNVMAYLARSNLALSVTITAVTTLLAVVLTPLWMKWLAGTLVQVHALNLMVEIVKIVLVPVGAALLHDYLKHASPARRRLIHVLAWVGTVILAMLLWLDVWRQAFPPHSSARILVPLGEYGVGAILFGALYHGLAGMLPWLDRWVPTLSMAGIVYFTLVTTAAGRDQLMAIGPWLFLVAVLHNSIGYALGYGCSRAAGLDKTSARSVAFEVGIQNGGMASGIAGAAGQLGTMGLAAAIFSPWMNISGSLLANYWRKRPVQVVMDEK